MFSLLIAFLFLSSMGKAQDDGVTYYHDGNFTYPDKFGMTYATGSSITITWETLYNRSNLFYSQYGDDANSVSIAANTDKTSMTWTVSTTKTNLSNPFHFRIVNAGGDSDSQFYGGFWSPGFYIRDDSKSAAADSVSSSSVSTASATSTAPATSLPASTAATSTPASTPTTQPSAAPSDSNDGTSISAGAVAGIVVASIAAVTMVGAGLFLLGRRSRGRHNESMGGPHGFDASPPKYGDSGQWLQPSELTHGPIELDAPAQKFEMGSPYRMVELDATGRR